MKKYIFLKILLSSMLVFASSSTFANDQLIFAVDLIRHGDRTPDFDIPNSPYAWKEGFGKLTAIGLKQEYNLGSQLRNKYINQYHLLSNQYSKDTLYVRSTDMDRTILSAKSFLAGLYPSTTQKNLSLIPVNTVPLKQDKLLVVKPSRNVFS